MASFTVKVRILGEAATSKAVNQALRDLNKLERQAARVQGRIGKAGTNARRARRGFGGPGRGGPGRGGRGFSERALPPPVLPPAVPGARRPRGPAGGVPPPIPTRFGGASKARRQLNLATSLGAVSGQSARIARQATNIFAAPIRAAADFETALTQVAAKSGATAAQMKALGAEARRLGADSRILASSVEAAGAQVFLAQAGFDPKQILGATEATLKFAQANKESVGFASDFLTDVVTPFNVLAKDASIDEINAQFTRFSDVMTRTTNKTNTNLRQLAQAMFAVAPTAAATGVEVEETAAAIGVLAGAGIKGGKAGTALRNIFLRLQSPAKAAQKAFAAVGLSSKSFLDAKGNLLPLVDTFKIIDTALEKTFGKDNLAAKSKAFDAIFGKRAIASATVLATAAKTGTLNAVGADLRTAGRGETARVGARFAGTTAGQLKAAQAQFEDLKIELGQAFIPALLDAVRAVTPLVQGLGSFAKEFPKVTAAVGGLLALTIPVALFTSAIAGIGAVMTGASSGLSKLNEVAKNSGGQFGKASVGAAKFTGALVALTAGFAVGSAIATAAGFNDDSGGEGLRVSAARLARESKFLKPAERKRLGGLRQELGTARQESKDFFGGASARERASELDKLVTALQAVAETRETEEQKVKLEIAVKADGSISAQATGATVVDTGRQTQGL